MTAALEIPMFLTEIQLLNIVNDVRKYLKGFDLPRDVAVYDNLMFGVRAYVSFKTGFKGLEIDEAEILDGKLYDVIELDSILLKHNLKDAIDEFNEKL